MKTRAKINWLFLTLTFLSSCYTYRPYLDSSQTSPEVLNGKFVIDKKYEITLTTGQKLQIKVDSLTEQYIRGQVFSPEKQFRQKNFMIPYDRIASVKNKRFNPVLTIIAVGVPIGALVLFISNPSFDIAPFSI